MNKSYLQLLLEYHYWARNRMFAAVDQISVEEYEREVGNSFPSIRATINHMYLGEWVWFSRWQGTSPMAFPSQDTLQSFGIVQSRWREQEHALRAFMAGTAEEDIAREFQYTLMNGTAAQSVFWEMFAHLVNHASYHRGQVTTMLRQMGAKPPESTDMIAYFRSLR